MKIFIDILKFIILIITTYYTCKIITNNNKRITYIGILLICFSSAIVEYIDFGLVEAIFFCEVIFISICNILENSKNKYLFACIIPAGILGFLLFSNISFQIVIGISFFSLIIWKILDLKKEEKLEKTKKMKKEFKNFKLDKKIMLILIIGILIAIIISIIFYKFKFVENLESNNGINYLTSYTYNIFRVFDKNLKYEYESTLSTFISVFPIVLFIGISYIFKEKTKHINFIIVNVIFSILELILIVSNIKIFFLPNYILVLGFNLLQIFMIIYLFSRVDEKLFNIKKSAYIALVGLLIFILFPVPKTLNKVFFEISYMIFVLEEFIILNYSDRRFWKLGSWVFTIICLFDFIGKIIVNFM